MTVAGKLERIFEHRCLEARRDEMAIPLSAAEQARLERLATQLAQEVPVLDEHDPYTLLPEPLAVEFVVGGHFGVGCVKNASAQGLAVVTAEPPPLGARLVLHLEQPLSGVEYTFPCRVVSRVVRGEAWMGVRFEGMASRRPTGGRHSGVFRNDATPSGVGKKRDA